MIKLSFREHHLLEILTAYDQQQLPLSLFVSHYFRAHKSLGSKDRGFIAETLYALIRWKGLIDYVGKRVDWDSRYQTFLKLDFDALQNDVSIPEHIRVSFPLILYDLIAKSHGKEKAMQLCRSSNSPAPTTIRVNTLKGVREELLESWKDLYSVSPCRLSPDGIVFHKKINFFELPEFKKGLFEVQDEGSQLLANLVQATPGQQVMDYCSGSGGKTLAFAPKMGNKGQIFLHDIRSLALIECRKRLRRAGIQNAQIVPAEDSKLKKLKKQMDWVIADVPCSGTGTLRRNPDMKWKFNEETLERLVGLQRQIFEKALSFLKPEGKIVYGTCSLLNEENWQQLDHFIRVYDLEVEGEPFHSLPSDGQMDGFFGVVLKRK